MWRGFGYDAAAFISTVEGVDQHQSEVEEREGDSMRNVSSPVEDLASTPYAADESARA